MCVCVIRAVFLTAVTSSSACPRPPRAKENLWIGPPIRPHDLAFSRLLGTATNVGGAVKSTVATLMYFFFALQKR